MVARVVPVDPFDLVIFGARGDFARRKLIPALYHRMHDGQMPEEARLVGVARADLDADGYRRMAEAVLDEFGGTDAQDAEMRRKFFTALDYVSLDVMQEHGWQNLKQALPENGTARSRAFYLSVAPRFFGPIAEGVHRAGLTDEYSRLVIEKPLGHDLASAKALNGVFAGHFGEHQIFRIDHYLGKETVQNLMALRFANAFFEPLWNARHIDYVQITVVEKVGVEGRGPYYDGIGAMCDMVQNHLLQLLCFVAMEPPSHFEPDAVHDEKLKVLHALTPLTDLDRVVRGQYAAGPGTPSYVEDADAPTSRTETFIALKAEVANWRWSGVPF